MLLAVWSADWKSYSDWQVFSPSLLVGGATLLSHRLAGKESHFDWTYIFCRLSSGSKRHFSCHFRLLCRLLPGWVADYKFAFWQVKCQMYGMGQFSLTVLRFNIKVQMWKRPKEFSEIVECRWSQQMIWMTRPKKQSQVLRTNVCFWTIYLVTNPLTSCAKIVGSSIDGWM